MVLILTIIPRTKLSQKDSHSTYYLGYYLSYSRCFCQVSAKNFQTCITVTTVHLKKHKKRPETSPNILAIGKWRHFFFLPVNLWVRNKVSGVQILSTSKFRFSALNLCNNSYSINGLLHHRHIICTYSCLCLEISWI